MSISVLIPCFNAGGKVLKAIASAINQIEASEIIVIDDGSTDDTSKYLALAKEQFTKDVLSSRMQIFSRENRGAQKTRNQLVEISKSEWLTFLDADDEVLGQESLLLRSQTDASVGFCNMIIQRYPGSDNEFESFLELWPTNRLPILKALARFEYLPSTSALMFKREVFTQVSWDMSDTYSGGMHCFKMLLDCLKAEIAIAHVPVSGILYREGWSPQQISGKANRVKRLFARYAWQKNLEEWLISKYGDRYRSDLKIGAKKFNEEWAEEIKIAASQQDPSNLDRLPNLDIQRLESNFQS